MKGIVAAPIIFASLLVSLSQMRPAGINHDDFLKPQRLAARVEINPLLKQAHFTIKGSLLDRLQYRKV